MSLQISEMQIETMRYYYSCTGMAKIEMINNTKSVSIWSNRNFQKLLVEGLNWYSYFEKLWDICTRIEDMHTYDLVLFLSIQ